MGLISIFYDVPSAPRILGNLLGPKPMRSITRTPYRGIYPVAFAFFTADCARVSCSRRRCCTDTTGERLIAAQVPNYRIHYSYPFAINEITLPPLTSPVVRIKEETHISYTPNVKQDLLYLASPSHYSKSPDAPEKRNIHRAED